jgi:hypothetical protein
MRTSGKASTYSVADKKKSVFLRDDMVYSKTANSQINILVTSFYHYVQLILTQFFREFTKKKIHGYFMQGKATDNRAGISATAPEDEFSKFSIICKLLCPRSLDSKHCNYYLWEKGEGDHRELSSHLCCEFW